MAGKKRYKRPRGASDKNNKVGATQRRESSLVWRGVRQSRQIGDSWGLSCQPAQPRGTTNPETELHQSEAGLPIEPVIRRIRNALRSFAHNITSLGISTGRDDAKDVLQALGLSVPVIHQLQPRHGAGIQRSAIRVHRRGHRRLLLHRGLERGREEVKHGHAGSREKVVPHKLGVTARFFDGEVDGRGEGLSRVGAELAAVEGEKRVGLRVQDDGGEVVPGLLGDAGTAGAREEGGDVEEDGEGAGGDGVGLGRGACVVLDAVAEGDFLELEVVGGWREFGFWDWLLVRIHERWTTGRHVNSPPALGRKRVEGALQRGAAEATAARAAMMMDVETMMLLVGEIKKELPGRKKPRLNRLRKET
jgi:hypothetical protein